MRPKQIDLTLVTPALNNVSLDQTTAGAGNFTITGSLASGGSVTLATAHRLDIECAGDINTVTFTITGTDEQGDAITDTVTGINASTVATTKYFKTITQIAVDGAVGTNTSVGTTDEAVSQIVPLDFYNKNFKVGLGIDISGTINYTVQHTFDSVLTGATPTWNNHTTLASKTTDGSDNYVIPVTATRIVVNSFTTGATLSGNIVSGR